MSPGLRGTSALWSVPATAAPMCIVASQNVAGLEGNLRTLVGACNGSTDVYCGEPFGNLMPIFHLIAREVGTFQESVALEPAGHAHELRGGHPQGHGVLARADHLTANCHRGRIDLVAPEDANRVEGLKVDVRICDENVRDIEVDGICMKIRRNE